MAGSGKTTLIQRLSTELRERHHPSYFINLDPAVTNIPYHPNVDIRDTVRRGGEECIRYREMIM